MCSSWPPLNIPCFMTPTAPNHLNEHIFGLYSSIPIQWYIDCSNRTLVHMTFDHVLLPPPSTSPISRAPLHRIPSSFGSLVSSHHLVPKSKLLAQKFSVLTEIFTIHVFLTTCSRIIRRHRQATAQISLDSWCPRCAISGNVLYMAWIGEKCQGVRVRELVDRVWHASIILGTTQPNKGPFLLHEGNNWENTMTTGQFNRFSTFIQDIESE